MGGGPQTCDSCDFYNLLNRQLVRLQFQKAGPRLSQLPCLISGCLNRSVVPSTRKAEFFTVDVLTTLSHMPDAQSEMAISENPVATYFYSLLGLTCRVHANHGTPVLMVCKRNVKLTTTNPNLITAWEGRGGGASLLSQGRGRLWLFVSA